ncbi:MAG: hypothetical protein J5671_04110 [Bacteroidaceae bacterium]|nr:hypothetical protein [Bacteroidaceae bacterium]
MRNRLLILLGAAFMTVASFAQTWTEPVEPTEGSDPVSGQLYRVKNVAAEMYIGNGSVFFGWNTTACLVENSAITWTMTYDEAKAGWTFAGYDGGWPGQYLFISGNGIPGYAMHVDNPTDPHRYYEIIKQESGNYRVRCVASDDTYGEGIENWENRFWGWNPDPESEYPTAMYAAVDPDEGYACEWAFVNMSLYFAQKNMYDLTVEIEEKGYDVDYSSYEAAYNSGDYDQTKAAYEELKVKVDNARVYAVLKYGDDGLTAPSTTNPCNATALIKNPSFDAGNIDGWLCTFKKTGTVAEGRNCDNCGYQGANYSNGDVKIEKFIEAWSNTANTYNPNYSWRALGDAELTQTLPALPQGLYKFTCDAIANQQDGHNPVTGVELFATGGELEAVQNISTGNGAPEHFEVTFVSTGGDIKLGLRTNNASANWIAADNFTLTYYGEVKDDPAKVLLDKYIAELEQKYGDVYGVKAEQSVKDAYEAAMTTAQNATEDYEAAQASLEAAAKALQESIDEYVKLKNTLTSISKQIRMASTDWKDLSFELSDLQSDYQKKYDECTATNEEIEALPDSAYNISATFISAALAADPEGSVGKEITLLLKNPGFDTEFSGWTVNKGNIVWGGENVGPLPEDHPAYPYTVEGIVDGGCAEKWHEAFDICQTIKNMPVGVFQLSCQAFERIDDGGKLWAELYATLNGSTQTQTVKDIDEDAQETALYDPAYGGGHGEAGTHNGDSETTDGRWRPNGMSSSNVYFRAGLYKNFFNIVVGMPSDMTVGIRTTNAQNWVLFDDFKIFYMGEDLEKYKEMIKEKQAELNLLLEENEVAVTDSVSTVVNAALAQGDEALASNVGKTCTDAIMALIDAAAAVTANLEYMQAFADDFYELQEFRYSQEGLDGDIPEIMEDVEDKLDPDGNEQFKDNAEVEQTRIELARAYNQFVQECLTSGASESEPADITYVIYNPRNDNYDPDATDPVGVKGWNVPVGNVGYGYPEDKSISEFYQTNKYEINQTIYGLNPGYYRLKVYGYYRDGNGARIDSCLNKVEGYVENSYARLFAGNAETSLLPISACYEKYTELVNDGNYEGVTTGNSVKITLAGEEEGETIYIPNGVAACKVVFNFDEDEDGEAPLYENILQFKVEEGQGDITIGLRKDHEDNIAADPENGIEAVNYGDWTVWDNWKLEFIGTDTPDVDPTTAIQGVEVAAPVKVAIYNLAGQRMNKAVKGVYIINGKKVLK